MCEFLEVDVESAEGDVLPRAARVRIRSRRFEGEPAGLEGRQDQRFLAVARDQFGVAGVGVVVDAAEPRLPLQQRGDALLLW